jgi:hypothetical protein
MSLKPRQVRFLAVYLAQPIRNGAAAYRELYPNANLATSAREAARILADPNVSTMVAQFDERMRDRLALNAEDMTRLWTQVTLVDRNELTELRRICCRYCWSPNGDPQFTKGEQRAREREHVREVQLMLAKMRGDAPLYNADAIKAALPFEELGGDGYDGRKPINPECQECMGLGTEKVIFKDTTTLSPAARLAFEGVKQTRNGLEYQMFSREAAAKALANRLGIGGGGEPPRPPGDGARNITPRDPQEAAKTYARLMDETDE